MDEISAKWKLFVGMYVAIICVWRLAHPGEAVGLQHPPPQAKLKKDSDSVSTITSKGLRDLNFGKKTALKSADN